MCFYYAVTKKKAGGLIKAGIIKQEQLDLFEEKQIVNGFEHPLMPVITDNKPDEIQFFQWGLLPARIESAEKLKLFQGTYNTLNAKAEDIENSYLYGASYKSKRCLVLCSGFFEWRKVKKEKIPYYITLKNDELFVFAGVWNETTIANKEKISSFSILTLTANELMAEIHNTKKRMPLILSPEDAGLWLQKDVKAETLQSIIKPIAAAEMKAHPIRKFLPSDTKNLNTAELIAYYHYPELIDLLSDGEFLG